MKIKEKDICKSFYHKVRILQEYNQFAFDFYIFHIANEQNTSKAYTLNLVKMGLRAGVADYCLLLPKGRVAFIEFKRNCKCKLTDKQKEFLEICNKLEIPHLVAWDADQAIDWIKGLN